MNLFLNTCESVMRISLSSTTVTLRYVAEGYAISDRLTDPSHSVTLPYDDLLRRSAAGQGRALN